MSNRRHPKKLMPPPDAFWNGLPTLAVRGSAVVADAPEFPQYWARAEGIIGDRIPVVWVNLNGVNYGGGVSVLDNRGDEGWRKVTDGRGGPGWPSKDVAIVKGSFRPEHPWPWISDKRAGALEATGVKADLTDVVAEVSS